MATREQRLAIIRGVVAARNAGTSLPAELAKDRSRAARPRQVPAPSHKVLASTEEPAPVRRMLARAVAREIEGMEPEQLVHALAVLKAVKGLPRPAAPVEDRQMVFGGMEGHMAPPILDLSGALTIVERVLAAVASHYGLEPGDLKMKTNAHAVSRPRQVAIYLLKKLTRMSYPEIARLFEGRERKGKHHTTAIHAVEVVEERMTQEPEFARAVHALEATLAA